MPSFYLDKVQILILIRFNKVYTYQKVLDITYQDFKSDKPYQVVLHPYFLKQYNSRWFLFGYNNEKLKYDWNLAIDRTISIEEKTDKYQKIKLLTEVSILKILIGVTKPKEVPSIKIRLLFCGDTCKYIINKPLHGSQKSKWINDTNVEVELDLIINLN